jgi:hypothetical protein
MTVRQLRNDDIPKLRKFHAASGLQYDFPDLNGQHIESACVVVDDNDEPLCAGIAERIVQIYFLSSDFGPPHARMSAIRMLHDSVHAELNAKGYNEANAFLPPEISKQFGRWLCRHFGWVRNWDSWCKRI